MPHPNQRRPEPIAEFTVNIDSDPNKGQKPDYWGSNELTIPPGTYRIVGWNRQNKRTGKWFVSFQVTPTEPRQPPIQPNPGQYTEQGRQLNQPFVNAPPAPHTPAPPWATHPQSPAEQHMAEQQPQYPTNAQGQAVDENGQPYYPTHGGGQRYQGD